jgi:hypothetical protein
MEEVRFLNRLCVIYNARSVLCVGRRPPLPGVLAYLGSAAELITNRECQNTAARLPNFISWQTAQREMRTTLDREAEQCEGPPRT